ncbi:MAG: hypothetical protein OQL09_07240 [Gammaproteobacteria bacterium]|nr:hypothetical protein [Gammaproteobacteria bacterium]
MHGNTLTGQIPAEIGNLPKLDELLLYDNQLEGAIPASIGNLSELSYFEVNNNRLSGKIPAELGNLPNMYRFFLDANQFVGELPLNLQNIGNQSATLYIRLGWNAAFSNDQTLNDFINLHHLLSTYQPSQTMSPSGIWRLSKTTTSIELGWAAFDTTPSTPGGYKILQGSSADGAFTEIADIPDRSITSTIIGDLIEGNEYWFKICSYTSSHLDNLKNLVVSEDSAAISKGVPIVIAGGDLTVNELTTVNLSSTASDPDGISVSYSWNQLSGTTVVLTGANTASASFIAPEVTTADDVLVFKVTVTDAEGDIAFDEVQVNVNNVLAAPTVDAGLAQTVNEGAAVSLTAFASDPNGTVVEYLWELLEGPEVAITNATSATASFTAPVTDNETEVLIFKVTVTDNDNGTASDTVTVTVNNVLTPPEVTAGIDQLVTAGDQVSLMAVASDENGTIDTYLWQQLAGTAVTITGNTTASASFTAPLVDDSLLFQITVTDNDGQTATDTILITVNQPPTVSAGSDQIVNEGNVVSLSAIADDGAENAVSYQWTQVSGPTVAITGGTTANASFTAPLIATEFELLQFNITVTDNNGATATDTVSITVNNLLIPPTVNAGDDQIADEFATVNLSATAGDANGYIVSYSWSQISGTAVTLSATNTASVSFTAPLAVDPAETLIFAITVEDNDGETATDQVQVTVNDVIIPPEVNTTTDLPGDEVEEQSWIELVADAHDLDGEIVSYYWEQLSGTEVTLESTDTATTRFQAPNISGNSSIRLLFKVTVTDDEGATDTSLKYVIITKKNVIVAGGGALSWPWLLLLAMPLIGRRFLK